MLDTEDLLIDKQMKEYDIDRFNRLNRTIKHTTDLAKAYHQVMKMVQYAKNMDYVFDPISDHWDLDLDEVEDWGDYERECLEDVMYQLISVFKNDNMSADQAQDHLYVKMLEKEDVRLLDFNKRFIETGEFGYDKHQHLRFMDVSQQYLDLVDRKEAQSKLQDDLKAFTLENCTFPTLSYDEAFQVALRLAETADFYEDTCVTAIFDVLSPSQKAPDKDQRYYFSPKGSRVGFADYHDLGWGKNTDISNIYNYILSHDVEIHPESDMFDL